MLPKSLYSALAGERLMHKDEMWQVYYENGEPVVGHGWEARRGNPEVTGSDQIVGVAIVFLYRENAEGELEFLWQRRSKKVDRYPGDWDISAGGHINMGESVVDGAIREAHEEIGAEINVSDLKFLTMNPFNRNRFAWIYMVDWTGREDEFCFDDEEVSEVKWVKYSEMEEFREKHAKKPLKGDKITFVAIDSWLRSHGNI